MNITKKISEKSNDSCMRMANERFGLEVLAKVLLSDLLCHDESIGKIIKLAKARKFSECSTLIEESKANTE